MNQSQSSAGRTLRLFLVDGTPSGIITTEIMNWTGHVLVSPRSRLPELLQRTEVSRTGVYFLVGDDPAEPNRLRVYIGESDNVGKRITQHSRDESKDFRTRLCLVTSKDQNLTKAHARYLECRLIERSLNVDRSNVANGTAPDFGFLPESDLADMNFFLNQIEIVLPVLGFDFLKPRYQRKAIQDPPSQAQPSTSAIAAVELVLNSRKHDLHAEAVLQDDEVTVLAGSQALVEGGFETNYARSLRDQLIADGSLHKPETGKHLIFSKDVSFSAPSPAAAVIFDRNTNGRTAWRVKVTGETLKEWQDAQLPAVESE